MAFSFGATPAAAPATPAFGSTPAPAPSSGFGFGSTPAPAPSTSLFGAPQPAPSFGFGGAPASSSPFGQPASSSPFGQPAAQQQQQPQQQLMMITSSTPYSSLPPEAKRAIDTIHDEIMRHKRTMNNVETMAPALLREPPVVNAADAAAGGSLSASNLQTRLQDLKHSLENLQVTVGTFRDQALFLQKQMQECTTQSVMYGMWPIEAVASRRGVKLSSDKKSIGSIGQGAVATIAQSASGTCRSSRTHSKSVHVANTRRFAETNGNVASTSFDTKSRTRRQCCIGSCHGCHIHYSCADGSHCACRA